MYAHTIQRYISSQKLPCRFAGVFSRSPMVEFQDDWETVSPSAGTGTRLLRQELDNHSKGLPPGLTAMPASRGRVCCLPCPQMTMLVACNHESIQSIQPHRVGCVNQPCMTMTLGAAGQQSIQQYWPSETVCWASLMMARAFEHQSIQPCQLREVGYG